ncbi:MAG: 3-coathanger stack domain-containing protein [Bacteroidota bacterium]
MKLFSKKQISLIFLLFISLATNFVFCQNELLNHKKYYYYKTRLQNDLMKVGLLPGESIPFNERGNQSWSIILNPTSTYLVDGGPINKLRAGDASARLGIYIAALATEYKLLKLNGQDLTKVKHEIFCALSAVNRIDFFAEQIIGAHPLNPNPAMPPTLNGFFVRDDIPSNFVLNNYESFNYHNGGMDNSGNPLSPTTDFGFSPTFPLGANGPKGQVIVESNKVSFEGELSPTKPWNDPCSNASNDNCKGIIHGFEASQDQMIYIMMGCALVKEMVDPNDTDNGAVFGFGANGTSLRQQAIDIVDRMVTLLKNDPLYNLRNPANNNNLVQTGATTGGVAYAFDNAACFIKHFGNGGDFTSNDMPKFHVNGTPMPFIIGTQQPLNACTDFRNATSIISDGTWSTYMSGAFASFGSPSINNNSIFSVLASICNCYFENKIVLDLTVQNTINNLNQALINLNNQLGLLPSWAIVAINWLTNAITYINNAIVNAFNGLYPSVLFNETDRKLTEFSKSTIFPFTDCANTAQFGVGSDLIFPVFVRDLLHQSNANPTIPVNLNYINSNGHSDLKNHLEDVLNTAPCMGNFYLFPVVPGPNWGASNRCDLPTELRKQGCADPKGEFAGTDYMLLHNLFYLREGFTIGTQDFSFRKATTSFPIGSNFTNTNIKTFGAYENITATNILNSNAGAIYRAGKEIALLPNGSGGFEVNLGADFAAVINPFHGTCGNPDMGKGSNNNDEMYDEPLNYVGSVSTKNPYSEKAPEYTGVESISVDLLNSQLDSLMRIGTDNVNFIHNKIEVYPTVNTGEFNIMFNLRNTDNVNFEIQDMVGKVVFSAKFITGELSMPVNLKGMAPGVYNIKFTGNESVTCIKRITIIN